MGSIRVPPPGLIELGLVYLAFCGLLVLRQRRQLYLLLTCVLTAVVLDGAYWWRERWSRQDLRITYLSVGQGGAAVVEFPGSKVLLIDSGGSGFGRFDPGRSIIAPFLRSRRIANLDYVLVSHPRVDHYGGMQSVLKEFSPGSFWPSYFRANSLRYDELERTISDLNIKRVILGREKRCRAIGYARLCILYPPTEEERETSVILRLSMGGFHFLFPGDIQKRGERRLVDLERDLSSQVLKVPRHGSKSSSSDAFVAAVQPKLAIFSVAGRSRFGLPNSSVVARYEKGGVKTLRTDRDGAITVEADGKRLAYWTHLSGIMGELNHVARVQ